VTVLEPVALAVRTFDAVRFVLERSSIGYLSMTCVKTGMKGDKNLYKGGEAMATRSTRHRTTRDMSRRQLLQTGLTAGATLATGALYHPATSWGAEAGTPVAVSCEHADGIRCTSIRI
jgi:hypothetical protein